MTLTEALAYYTRTLLTRAKPATVRSAQFHGAALTRTLGGGVHVEEIRQADLDRAILSLRGEGWRDTSINGSLRVLSAAARLAEAEGLAPRSPRVKLLRETRKIPAVLTAQDVQELMAQAPGPDERLALALAAYAGLRHQEIAHLAWADLDTAGRVVRVTAKPGWCPKAHAEREVPMNADLAAAVRLHEGVVGRDKPLFSARDFTVGVREAFQKAGLWDPAKRPGLHMLRRTFASRLLGTGADVNTVRELGGWADLDVVQRYLSSTNDLKRAAVERL